MGWQGRLPDPRALGSQGRLPDPRTLGSQGRLPDPGAQGSQRPSGGTVPDTYSSPTTGLDRELLTGQRIWSTLIVAGSTLVVVGLVVLPWFNKAAVFREGAGLTFFQWYQQTESMVPYYVAMGAYVAVAAVAFTKASQWPAWAGIVLACATFVVASWKMSAMLLVPTPLELTIGVGFYALMTGTALILVGSIMRLTRAHAQ